MTPEQRRQRAQIAARTRWAHQDGHQGTQAARDRFLERFLDEVDPDRRLPLEVREKRAENAKRVYFQAMARNRHAKAS